MDDSHSHFLKQEAHKLGFLDCKIAKAVKLEKEAKQLEVWLKEKKNGQMDYMNNHFELRIDPRKMVDNARSVICLSYNYYTDTISNDSYKISKYAYGKDYHKIIRKKLKQLVQGLKNKFGDFNARVFVDSAPILEKSWAVRSGIGWMGKNTNVIHPRQGSFFFLAEIICDLEFNYDTKTPDRCGDCTRCIDACPTDALNTPYHLEADKCISYLTIELKDQIPNEFKGKMDDWIFGCDVCQDVCPWNKFSSNHNEDLFNIQDSQWTQFSNNDWLELKEDTFNKMFEGSAIKRTKFEGLKRNIKFINA